MAIAFVRTFNGSAPFVATMNASVPAAGCAAGNLLVVSGLGESDSAPPTSVTDSKLNSYSSAALPVTNFTGQGCAMQIFYSVLSVALVSGDTVTVNATGAGGMVAVLSEFSGIASSPLDQKTSQNDAFDVGHSSGSTAATTQADELLVGMHIVPTGRTWAATGSFTEIDEFDPHAFQKVVQQYRIVAATGAYASTGDMSSAQVGLNGIATFKASAAGAAPPRQSRPMRSRGISW